jgi:nicotinamidase-related amidase
LLSISNKVILFILLISTYTHAGLAFLSSPFLTRQRSTPNLQQNVKSLLAAFRSKSLPIIHIHHLDSEDDPLSPWNRVRNPEGVKPQSYVVPLPNEPVLEKYTSSAFGAVLVSSKVETELQPTSLQQVLNARGIKALVLVGQSSAHCVSSTARSASDLGYNVVVVADATATYNQEVVRFDKDEDGEGAGSEVVGDWADGKDWAAETVHGVAMAEIDGNFGHVVRAGSVLRAMG